MACASSGVIGSARDALGWAIEVRLIAASNAAPRCIDRQANMMISPLMSGEYRFVEDGDALCLRHEVRAAALRHPADEANDVLLCCAVIPGWSRFVSPRDCATAKPTKSALATNPESACTRATMRRAASLSPRRSSNSVAVPAKSEREPNEEEAVKNCERADDRDQRQRTGRGSRQQQQSEQH